MPISTNAPFSEFGQSMVLRDIEHLYLMLGGSGSGAPGDGQTQDQSAVQDQETGDDGGTGTGSGAGGTDLSGLLPWTIPNGGTGTTNPTRTLTIDSTDTTDAAGLTVGGTYFADSWTLYEKRPRWNAKWLQGSAVSTTAPSADEQALLWNASTSEWEAITLIASAGGLLTKDGAGLIEVNAGAALSVVGNATNTAGSFATIAAAAADTVLGRRGTALTWAKISTNELNDAAVTKAKMENSVGVSVVGRSAGSTGVVADIAAGSDNLVLGRRSGALTWAKVARAELADGSARSVVGRSTNSSGAVADIAAAADGVMLGVYSGSVGWSDTPTLIRSSVTFNVCSTSTITSSTTTPSSSAVKGELYFIY